jgi:hypothetical protein
LNRADKPVYLNKVVKVFKGNKIQKIKKDHIDKFQVALVAKKHARKERK